MGKQIEPDLVDVIDSVDLDLFGEFYLIRWYLLIDGYIRLSGWNSSYNAILCIHFTLIQTNHC